MPPPRSRGGEEAFQKGGRPFGDRSSMGVRRRFRQRIPARIPVQRPGMPGDGVDGQRVIGSYDAIFSRQ